MHIYCEPSFKDCVDPVWPPHLILVNNTSTSFVYSYYSSTVCYRFVLASDSSDVIILPDEELDNFSESSDVELDCSDGALLNDGRRNCHSKSSDYDDTNCSDVILIDDEKLKCCSEYSDVHSNLSDISLLDCEGSVWCSKSNDDGSSCLDVISLDDDTFNFSSKSSDMDSGRCDRILLDDEEPNFCSKFDDNSVGCHVIVLDNETPRSCTESSDVKTDWSDVIVLDDNKLSSCSESYDVESGRSDDTPIDDGKQNGCLDSSDVETYNSGVDFISAEEKPNCSLVSLENDAAQAQISDLLQSLLYKCRLYGKFFEKRREQQFQRIVQSEHRKRKRLERLQNRKTVLTEINTLGGLGLTKSAVDYEKADKMSGCQDNETPNSCSNWCSSVVKGRMESPKCTKRDIDVKPGCGYMSIVSDEVSSYVAGQTLTRIECCMDFAVMSTVANKSGCGDIVPSSANIGSPAVFEHAEAPSCCFTPEKIDYSGNSEDVKNSSSNHLSLVKTEHFLNSSKNVAFHASSLERDEIFARDIKNPAVNQLCWVNTEDPNECILDFIEEILRNIADKAAFNESSTLLVQDFIGDCLSSCGNNAALLEAENTHAEQLKSSRLASAMQSFSVDQQFNIVETSDLVKCAHDSVVYPNSCFEVAAQSKSTDSSSRDHIHFCESVRVNSSPVWENTINSSIFLTPEDLSSYEIPENAEASSGYREATEICSPAIYVENASVPTVSMTAGELSSTSFSNKKFRKLKDSPVLLSPDQPVLLSGGILRQYQLDGVNWLKLMYECGFSGILADEMGLGKTIQCISLICHLIAQRVCGPFLICAPLSAIATWVNELKQFAPKVPVVVYHGDQQERIMQRSMLYSKPKNILRTLHACPVVLTTYDLVISDRQFLCKTDWRLIVVDEGHRIRNVHCRLMRELSLYKTPVKLLITGTPMQNGVDDLCSLLIFLVPELSGDIISLQNCLKKWFNAQMLEDSTFENLIKQTKFECFLATMHQILTPFMLRRLKSDVALTIPPKKELIVSAPLTIIQQEIYQALFIRAMEIKSIKHESILEYDEADKLHQPCNTAVSDERNQGESYVGTADPEKRTLRKRRYKLGDSYFAKNGTKEIIELEHGSSRKKARQSKSGSVTNYESSGNGTSTSSHELSIFRHGLPVGVQLNNLLLELRRCCNHPMLVGDLSDVEMNESMVSNCGKLSILDKLLIELKKDSHKVLIFCQLIDMLDILESYCEMRQFNYCRIDGTTMLSDRAKSVLAGLTAILVELAVQTSSLQIDRFNKDENVFVFLLTTRSGGVGINLTAADTVVIYESDWNPQWDTQAQDRCHRIGQTRPVVVYRFLARNTVDEKMFLRARAKTRLEKLVIHKDKFKSGIDDGTTVTTEELLALLRESELLKDDMDAFKTDELDLRRLLDRTDLHDKWTAAVAD